MLRSFLIALSSTAAITTASAAPNVVVSIKPVHSLATGVMKGIGEPTLLIEGTTSPHDFTMRPSQAQNIQDADIVIWIGEGMESFLTKSMENEGNHKKSMELMDVKGISLLEYREHAHGDDHGKHKEHAEHKDDDHDHKHGEEHAEHKHEEGHDHKHDEAHAHGEKKEDAHHGHNHAEGGKDPHIWLDIDNAKTITTAIAEKLSKKDPENASTYTSNATQMIQKLDALNTQLTATLQGSQNKEYVVFHDAYQYFENHFGLSKPIPITLNPEVQPSAARIKEIQEEVTEHKVSCMFSEPQFSPKVLSVVAENTSATISTIDPLGALIEKGENHYFEMMGNLATNLSNCLKN